MKILFLTPWYPDENNSFHGIFVRDQAIAVKQQHEVLVISSKINYNQFGAFSSHVSEHEFEGVQEFRIRIKKSFPVFNQFNYFFLTVWHSRQVARTFKPDIIHGNIGYPGAFWAWCVSKILRKPFIVTEHTRIANNFRSHLHKWLTTFSLKRASAIVAVSQWQADEISKLLSRSPKVIPNIIRVDKFKNVSPASPSTPVQFGFLGSMNTRVKGLDLILKAISTIQRDFIFHIGGDGILMEEYKSLAKELQVFEKCIFYGTLLPEQVPSFMSRLHFFVSASRMETFGIAIVEAMATGLPVISTDCGGPRDFILPENGLLLPKENVYELQLGIERMMESYGTYNSEAIREFVKIRFSLQHFLQEITTLYKAIQ